MSKVLSVLAKAVKEDEESAAELMDQIAMEVIADQIDAHGADVEAIARPWMVEQVAKAKRGLLRGYVSKAVDGTYPDEEYQRTARHLQVLEQVIKASADEVAFEQRERAGGVKRDARGRFSRQISHNPVSSLSHVRDEKRLSPANRNLKAAGKDVDKDPARDKFLAEQGEWEDAQRKMKEFRQTFPGSTRHVDAVFSFRRPNGESEQFRMPLSGDLDANVAAAAGYELDDKLDLIEIQPGIGADEKLQNKVATFNDIAGKTGSPQAARLMTSYDPEKLAAATTAFGVRDDPNYRRGLKSFFNRTQAAGNVLEGISGTEKYGRMVRLAGEFGSDADRALGPAAQRAAYRYRGTEKEADPDLRRAFVGRDMRNVDALAESDDPEFRAQVAGRIREQAGTRAGVSPVVGALQHRLRESATRPDPMLGDELSMKVRSDVAVDHMIRTLPDDPRAAELSRKSGHVLPSQGVIIDRDGDVASQAVGYGEDHYLPFDLKNVRSLKGGQYVRTRMEGGPTGEDVYALVATGARMGTVVSPSGVFTLEMDPNFRGRRGASDKARMVYQRYLEILDAVEGSGLYVRDLSPADKARVDETAHSMGIKRDSTEYDALLQAKREEQMKLSPDDVEQIEADARKELQGDARFTRLSTPQQNAEVSSLTEERVTERQNELVRALSLNAEGYALAMKTLQQQFPYFIRTASYEPLRDKASGGGFFAARNLNPGQAVRQRAQTRDKGYVRPGGLRSEETEEDFYHHAGARRIKGAKKPEPEAAAAPAAAAAAAVTASTGAGAAPAAAGTSTPASTAPAGPLATALAGRQAEFTSKRDNALKELKQAWGLLGQANQGALGPGLANTGGADQKWEDAKGRRNLEAAWLLDADPAQFNEVMASDQQHALEVLSDRDLIASTVRGKLSAGAAGWGDSQAIEALQLPDVKDADSFAKYVADTAQRVVDYQQLSNPAFFRSTESPWDASGPVLPKDLGTITTTAGLDAYAKQHPEAARMAKTIGLSNDRPRRFSDMKADVEDRLKAIKPFSTFQESFRNAGTSVAPDVARDRAVSQKLSEAGVDLDGLARATGRTFANNAEVADWAMPKAGVPGADRTAMDIQRAWSLAATSRLVDFAEGGDLVPKDQPALAKVAKAAPLPLRAAVLPPSDPRSAVAKQLVAGLPLPRGFRAPRR